MEIGPRTIIVFLIAALIEWNECGRFVCFIETMMILNALQWVYRLFGALVGENAEERLMEEFSAKNLEQL